MHAYFGDKGGAGKLKKLMSEGKENSSHSKALEKAKGGKKMTGREMGRELFETAYKKGIKR